MKLCFLVQSPLEFNAMGLLQTEGIKIVKGGMK
jgi:hypothetical protein